jgi:hypothetical protein
VTHTYLLLVILVANLALTCFNLTLMVRTRQRVRRRQQRWESWREL